MNPNDKQPADLYSTPPSPSEPPQPSTATHVSNISPLNAVEKPVSPISVEARQRVSDLYPPVAENIPQQLQPQPQPQFQPVSQVDAFSAAPIQPPSDGLQSFAPAPAPVITQNIVAQNGFGADSPKKSKKPLFAGIIAVVLLLILGGGSAVFAVWYSNPDKVLIDAVANIVRSKTMITEGNFEYQDKANKGSVGVKFTSQTDNPKAAGSLDATVNIDYAEFQTELKGAGMVADSGDLYFKVDNASELLEKALKTEYGAMYTQEPSMAGLIAKLRAFVKKIDGQWIKIDKSDIAEFQKEYEKQQACSQKALDTFYEDNKQQQQVIDLYTKHKFIIVKDNGKSEAVNGQDSIQYDLKFNAKQAEGFGRGLEGTDLYKALAKCENDDSSQDSSDSSYDYKPTDKELAETQKELDKITTTVWVSRWAHDFTKVQVAGSNDDYSAKLTTVLDTKKQPNLAAPSSSLKAKDLMTELEGIYSEASGVYGGGQAEAQSSVSKVNAGKLASEVESYASNHRGAYPTLSQLQSTVSEEALKKVVSNEAPNATAKDRVQYAQCDNGNGYSIYYWNETSSSLSGDLGYGCELSGALPSISSLQQLLQRSN